MQSCCLIWTTECSHFLRWFSVVFLSDVICSGCFLQGILTLTIHENFQFFASSLFKETCASLWGWDLADCANVPHQLWRYSFWKLPLFVLCIGDWLNGQFSRTAESFQQRSVFVEDVVFQQALNNFTAYSGQSQIKSWHFMWPYFLPNSFQVKLSFHIVMTPKNSV